MADIKKTAEEMGKKIIKPFTKSQKKDLATMHDLFLVQMKDLYDNEKQLVQALPKVIKKTTSPELKELVSHHLKETQDHVARLEQVYALMNMKPKRQPSKGMKGLLDDGKEVMGMSAEPELMDAAITANSQHIEYHEIAGYKATIEWAKLLKMPEAVELMKQNLEQEEKMEKKLTELAKRDINKKASVMK